MADDFAQEFLALADRFLWLRADDLSDDKGQHATMRAAGAGAQIVKRAVDAGRLRELAEQFPPPPNDAALGPAFWAASWVSVSQWLQCQKPDKLPPDIGAFSVVARTPTDHGTIKETRKMRPEGWRLRAEDYAQVSRVFADMVAPVAPPKPSDGSPEPSGEPKKYLLSWREILIALELKNDKEGRDKVRTLNDRYGGPIIPGVQGGQPKADKDALLAWWNHLEVEWSDQVNQARGSLSEASAQHNYGRAGVAAPEVSGEIKRPRKDRAP